MIIHLRTRWQASLIGYSSTLSITKPCQWKHSFAHTVTEQTEVKKENQERDEGRERNRDESNGEVEKWEQWSLGGRERNRRARGKSVADCFHSAVRPCDSCMVWSSAFITSLGSHLRFFLAGRKRYLGKSHFSDCLSAKPHFQSFFPVAAWAYLMYSETRAHHTSHHTVLQCISLMLQGYKQSFNQCQQPHSILHTTHYVYHYSVRTAALAYQ